MEKPAISAIVPSLNSGRSIAGCLDSILGQDCDLLEVIIADGQSADTTLAIVKDYAKRDSRVTFFSERDRGIYDAINKAIPRAAGDWIYILGTDDRLARKTVFSELLPLLRAAHGSVVYGDVIVSGEAGWARDGTVYDGEFDLSKLLRKNICQQAVFYRRAVFQDLGFFDPRYKVCADWDFILRCVAREKIQYVNSTIAIFKGGGTSHSSDPIFTRDFVQNLYRYFGRSLASRDFSFLRPRMKRAAVDFFMRGEWLKALQLFRHYRAHSRSSH